MILRRLLGDLPEWARSDHPILRYEMERANNNQDRTWINWLVPIAVLVLLLLGGVAIATQGFAQPAGVHLTEGLLRIIIVPAILLQFGIQIAALILSSNMVVEERRRQTWDHLRATETGTDLTLRARWVAMFYRLRIWLGVVIFIRILLVLAILYDLTAFRGGYLDILAANADPSISLVLGIVILVFVITTSFLLPLTNIGFDTALGLLLATLIKSRTAIVIVQALLVIIRLAIVAALIYLVSTVGLALYEVNVLLVEPIVDPFTSWMVVFAYSAWGDWGVALTHLGTLGEVWALISNGVLIGVALFIWMLAQAGLADALLRLAVIIADRRG